MLSAGNLLEIRGHLHEGIDVAGVPGVGRLKMGDDAAEGGLQAGDMVYSEAGWRRFLSFGRRTTMLYALERESDLGALPPREAKLETHLRVAQRSPFCSPSCATGMAGSPSGPDRPWPR
jgi:hypothetical protein